MRDVDQDGDGAITLEEFRNYWMSVQMQAETHAHAEFQEKRRSRGASMGSASG